MDQWYQHFYNVFSTFFDNDSNGIDDDEVDDEHSYDENDDSENDDTATLECDITECEVYDAIRMLKNGKAAGPDLIIGDFFQNFCKAYYPLFSPLLFFFLFLKSGLYHDNWSEPIVQPLFKKGDPIIPDNYRGISLFSICSKLYSCITEDLHVG